MEITYPFYNDFSCIASACRHSCCIGWEVDIDKDTLKKYEALPGELGVRLRDHIEQGDVPCFRLDEHDRCPMLGADGLCDIQRRYGEEYLSQICRDHPRYRVFLDGRTEMGLGLCCEEACRLLLSQTEPITLKSPKGERLPKNTRELLLFRDRLLTAAQERSRPLSRRMLRIHGLARVSPAPRSRRAWCDILDTLEPLEEEFTGLIRLLRSTKPDFGGFAEAMAGRMAEYENLLTYFLLRHVLADEGRDMPQRAAFSVWCTVMLYALGAALYTQNGLFSFSDQTELCRCWSANVEYSEKNMQKLLALF